MSIFCRDAVKDDGIQNFVFFTPTSVKIHIHNKVKNCPFILHQQMHSYDFSLSVINKHDEISSEKYLAKHYSN